MTDPHLHHQLPEVGTRRPGLAHIICTGRPACTPVTRVLIFHRFERQRPPLRERIARRHTPDVVIELIEN